MPSETFVDVNWRGLEVGRRVKLRAIRTSSAYLDHATPMPVGSLLAIKTAEGIDLSATVTRVHEQVGGLTNPPGMLIMPTLAGAAVAWWAERAEPDLPPVAATPVVAPPAAAPSEPVAAAPAMPEPTQPMVAIAETQPVPVTVADDEPSSRTTLPMTTDQIAEAAAESVRADDGPVVEDTGSTQVMAAISEEDLAAMERGETIDERPAPGPRADVLEDGSRTMVMSAIEVTAIAETAGDDDGEGDGDDGPADAVPNAELPADGSNGDGAARGKRRGRSNRRKKR